MRDQLFTAVTLRRTCSSPDRRGFILLAGMLLATFLATGAQLEGQEQADDRHAGLTLIEAVRYTLLHHPALLTQQAQVQIERGTRLVASSAFDGVFNTGISQSTTAVAEGTTLDNSGRVAVVSDKFTQTTYSAGYAELFRNGMSIAPTYQMSRELSPYLGPGGLNTSVSGLTLTVPLLRGRGRRAVAAQENAAKEEVSAALLDLDQEIAQLIVNTAGSYWRLLAAKRFLGVAIDAEQRGKTSVDNAQALVDADRVPRNDLHEVVANLAQLSSERVAAESAVVAARLQLASDMGLTVEQMVRDVPDPSDQFPDSTIQTPPSHSTEALRFYVEQAIQRRADYLAATRRAHEQNILMVGARNRLLPQLDLALGGGYTQAQPGTNVAQFFSAPGSQRLGPNVSGSITLSLPFRNRAALGSVMQSSGAAKQADLNVDIVARNIGQTVGVTIERVRAAGVRVQQTSDAVHEFQTALAGARQKYALGFGSIVEILTIEDRLTTALNSKIQAQLDYAEALAQFRFATGTLLESGQPTQHISSDVFVTLPFPEGTPR
jgi:outer membrane protein